MSHYKPYPTYKDSGVEWLGQVPSHWSVRAVKTLGRLDGGAGFPDSEQGQSDNAIPFFKVAHLATNLRFTEHTITHETAKALGARIFPADTIAFAKVGAALLLNRRCLLENPSCFDNNMMALIPMSCNPRWLLWAFSILDMERIVNPGAVPSINQEQVGGIKLGVPEQQEQLAIANHLDRETARIDGLVSKKTRFIELLREKRQALITHAVTKGLDPDAPMKDSGVEWLGDVPAHWDVTPLKYLATFRSGGTPSKDNLQFWDGEIPWASAKDLKKDQLDDTSDHITDLAVKIGGAALVPTGSTLVVVRGMILARLFPVVEAMVPMAINQDLKALTAAEVLYDRFLAYLLRGLASESLRRLEEAGHGTKALRMEGWTSMLLTVPPLVEQQMILDFILSENGRIDSLICMTERSIELLKERRSALITAAVTGQIDLREAA